jgi:hypothetical protein
VATTIGFKYWGPDRLRGPRYGLAPQTSEAVKMAIQLLNLSIQEMIGDQVEHTNEVFPRIWKSNYSEVPPMEQYKPKVFDGYLTVAVMLPYGNEVLKARVVTKKRDANGISPVGKANSKPVLDARKYIVEFEDGAQEVFAAYMIAENMYTQVARQRRIQTCFDVRDYQVQVRCQSNEEGRCYFC